VILNCYYCQFLRVLLPILLVIKSSATDATKHKNHVIDRFAYCMAYKYDMFADTMGDLGKLTGPKIFLCI